MSRECATAALVSLVLLVSGARPAARRSLLVMHSIELAMRLPLVVSAELSAYLQVPGPASAEAVDTPMAPRLSTARAAATVLRNMGVSPQ